MAEYSNKLIYKKAIFSIVGAILVLLASEALIPQIAQQPNKAGEKISQETLFIVGEVEPYATRMDYSRQSNKGQIITYPGASFIKVHFSSLDLMPGDYVTVADPTGAEKYTYPGSDSTSDGQIGFWSISITGDTAVVQLHSRLSTRELSSSDISRSGFVIDKYGRGYPQEEIERILFRSSCGINERKDVACYQGTNPSEFDKSNSVARLLIYHSEGYYAFCTAWRVGVGANMLTNQHCLTSQTDVTASEAWFNYQNQTCGISSVGSIAKVTGNQMLRSDLALDFALFTINDPESIVDFSYLDIEARPPILGEQIYIPQHGGSAPKQFGIESDLNEGNVCRIDATAVDGLDNGTDTGYYCDTASGSSGAPVLASSSNKVIAIHHFGSSSTPNCTALNQGVRMDLIWPQVEPYFLQLSPFGSIDNYKPTYRWNKASNTTRYYLWINGPSGKIHDSWYESSAICSDNTCSVTPDIPLAGGQHTWWIQTFNSDGYGPWSNGMNFSVPVPPLPGKVTLFSPAKLTIGDLPIYTWKEDSDATWYYLWVDGPSGNVIKQWYTAVQANCDGATCSITSNTSLSAGRYIWWVQTWNAAGLGPWSEGMTFIPSPPREATLISPTGIIAANTPIYTWNEVPGSTWYYLWVDGPSGNVIKQWYTAVQANCDGTTCSIVPTTTLSNGSHIWWVQTWNTVGFGPWSAGMTFNPSPPGQATLVSPATTATNTPTYTWNEVPGSTWYYLWVDGPSGTVIQQWYTSVQANCNGTTCSVRPSITLAAGSHIWWVQTWNDAGYGPWSDGRDFLTP